MKNALREKLRRLPVPRGGSEAIQRRLLAQDWWTIAFQVGIYRSTPAEPSTEGLLKDLFARHAQVAVPVQKGKTYGWGWVDFSTVWKTKAHGILEPATSTPVSAAELRVILVPGLAFDAKGGRLGHGKGHFDRLLAQTNAFLIGLCFENHLVEAVPMEAHDVRMDAVVTEKRIIFAPAAEAKLGRLLG